MTIIFYSCNSSVEDKSQRKVINDFDCYKSIANTLFSENTYAEEITVGMASSQNDTVVLTAVESSIVNWISLDDSFSKQHPEINDCVQKITNNGRLNHFRVAKLSKEEYVFQTYAFKGSQFTYAGKDESRFIYLIMSTSPQNTLNKLGINFKTKNITKIEENWYLLKLSD